MSEQAESTGTVTQSVGNGVSDGANQFPYVGRFGLHDSSCSATLITPAWVLTANHCITGQCDGLTGACVYYPDTDKDVTILFGRDLAGAPDGQGSHTYGTPVVSATGAVYENRIAVRNDGVVDLWIGNDGAAQDIALIRLDRRIRISDVPPLHPPLASQPACFNVVSDSNDFFAYLVGFGRVGGPIAPGDPVTFRSYARSGDWDREEMGDGGEHIYQNTWVYGLTPYRGILHGDSGGPLVAFACEHDPIVTDDTGEIRIGLVAIDLAQRPIITAIYYVNEDGQAVDGYRAIRGGEGCITGTTRIRGNRRGFDVATSSATPPVQVGGVLDDYSPTSSPVAFDIPDSEPGASTADALGDTRWVWLRVWNLATATKQVVPLPTDLGIRDHFGMTRTHVWLGASPRHWSPVKWMLRIKIDE